MKVYHKQLIIILFGTLFACKQQKLPSVDLQQNQMPDYQNGMPQYFSPSNNALPNYGGQNHSNTVGGWTGTSNNTPPNNTQNPTTPNNTQQPQYLPKYSINTPNGQTHIEDGNKHFTFQKQDKLDFYTDKITLHTVSAEPITFQGGENGDYAQNIRAMTGKTTTYIRPTSSELNTYIQNNQLYKETFEFISFAKSASSPDGNTNFNAPVPLFINPEKDVAVFNGLSNKPRTFTINAQTSVGNFEVNYIVRLESASTASLTVSIEASIPNAHGQDLSNRHKALHTPKKQTFVIDRSSKSIQSLNTQALGWHKKKFVNINAVSQVTKVN